MTEDDTEAQTADERRRLRQAALEAANEHGRSLIERYGRQQPRERYASVGHAGAKRRRS
jgi:hypothetical protein